MARAFYTPIDLTKNELQNAVVQNLGSAPSSPVKGQIYLNSSDNTLYYWDGSAWVAAKSGAPSGAAGGDLTGTYPNPTIGVGKVTSSHILDATIVVGDTAASFDLGALATAHATTTDVALNSKKITGLADPAAAQDAATKAYVDGVAQGLDPKQSVRVLSTTLVGGTVGGAQTVDGIALNNNDRVLINNGTLATNGIYLVNTGGTWGRAFDFDAWAEVPSAFVFVEEGTVYADTGWVCTANTGGTLGTTAIAFTQFSGAGSITAGAGLTQTGTTINAVALDGSIVVAADSIAVGYAGSGGAFGTAVTAARSDHTHAGAGTVRKVTAACASATSTVVDITTLNTRDVTVEVYRSTTPWDKVECDVEHTSATSVTVRFATAPAAGAYNIVVLG